MNELKLPEPDTHCLDDEGGRPIDVWSYSPEMVRQIIAADRAQRKDTWREAIDEARLSLMLDITTPGADPAASVKELVAWANELALNPAISSDAQALIDRGIARQAERHAEELLAYEVTVGNLREQGEPVAWGMPDACGNIVEAVTADDVGQSGELKAWRAQYSVPLYTAAPAPERERCAHLAKPQGEPVCARCESLSRAVMMDQTAHDMNLVAEKYAHKLALDLECVLSDYSGKWWSAAIETIGKYREEMNAIHERESPTFMGEPRL